MGLTNVVQHLKSLIPRRSPTLEKIRDAVSTEELQARKVVLKDTGELGFHILGSSFECAFHVSTRKNLRGAGLEYYEVVEIFEISMINKSGGVIIVADDGRVIGWKRSIKKGQEFSMDANTRETWMLRQMIAQFQNAMATCQN